MSVAERLRILIPNNLRPLAEYEWLIYKQSINSAALSRSKNESTRNLPTKKTRAFKKHRQLTVLFGRNRMAHYFGSDFVHPFEVIEVDSSFLNAVDEKFTSMRPAFRLNRSIDLHTNRILSTSDASRIPPQFDAFCEGSTLCVEIKPKFGAIPCGPAEDEIEAAIRRNAMFCIMQYHENKLRMWGQPSSYCPCDLFSGNLDRMRRAIFAMLAVRQNNLRVFQDCHCVLNNNIDRLDEALMDFFYPKATSLDSLDSRQAANFTSSYDSIQVTPPSPQVPLVEVFAYEGQEISAKGTGIESEDSSSDNDANDVCAKVCQPSECLCDPTASFSLRHSFVEGLVIPTLLAEFPSKSDEQSSLDGFVNRSPEFRYDCDLHPYPSSNGVKNGKEMNSSSLSGDIPKSSPLGRIYTAQLESPLLHKDLIEPYKKVSAYFEEHDISWNSYIGGKVIINLSEAPPSLSESLNLVEKHLIAMVARDCSIMLTFRRAIKDCPDDIFTIGGDGQRIPKTIVYSSIVDLDPKELSNLQERVDSEREAVKQFLALEPNLLLQLLSDILGELNPKNFDEHKKRSYLSKFLTKVRVPADFMQDSELNKLYSEHEALIEAFKNTHKQLETIKHGSLSTCEVKNDITVMQEEKDQLLRRINRMKMKVENFPSSIMMLPVARKLRLERERKAKLAYQLQQQRIMIGNLEDKVVELRQQSNELQRRSADCNAENLLNRLEEEVKINQYLAIEKQPKEINEAKTYLEDLTRIANQPALTYSYLNQLNQKLRETQEEICRLIEKHMTESDPFEDKAMIFRQQANIAANRKASTASTLAEAREKHLTISKELKDMQEKNSNTLKKKGYSLNDDEVSLTIAQISTPEDMD
ncbi:hypothetical protein ACTXT7_005882 [Hymenolepis weldensis]